MADAFDQIDIVSMWERSRRLREVPRDLETLSVACSVLADIVHEEMKCPICLGTIESTLTVTTCLHRFCTECLERSLRVNLGPKDHHDCPACRAKLASRRDSKRDDRFDFLIDVFSTALGSRPPASRNQKDRVLSPRKRGLGRDDSGLRDGEEEEADEDFARTEQEDQFDAKRYRAAHLELVEQFREKQRKIIAERKSSDLPGGQALVGGRTKSSAPRAASAAKLKENRVCLALFPSSEGKSAACLLALSMPFLKVPPLMQVGDLKQFLNLKFSLSKHEYDQLEIFVVHQSKTVILDELLTMSDVLMLYWETNSELRLYYRLRSSPTVEEDRTALRPQDTAMHISPQELP